MSLNTPTDAQAEAPGDPLIDGLVSTLMTHAAPQGAVDYPVAAAAIAQVLAEMIGPQEFPVRKKMREDFLRELDRAIQLTALRSSVVKGDKQ